MILRGCPILLLILLLVSAFYIRGISESEIKKISAKVEFKYTFPDRVIKLAACGYDIALGDLYWLRSLQNMDIENQHRRKFSYLYHLFDIASTLQPSYRPVYTGGGGFLSVIYWDYEGGEKIFLKGLKQYPQDIHLLTFLSMLYTTDLQDFKKAAHYMERASNVPGAPQWYKKLAARLFVEASRPDVALRILTALYRSEKNEKTRKELARKIKLVFIDKQIWKLKKLKSEYEAAHGKLKDLGQLVDKKYMESLPPDPFGGKYFLSSTGEIKSSSTDERYRPYLHKRYRRKDRDD